MKNIFNILIQTSEKEKLESALGRDNKVQKIIMNVKLTKPLNNKSTSNGHMSNLSYNMFLQSLALSSFYSSIHEDKGVVEKIIYLTDKMGNSLGIRKSQLLSGQTL
jgi:hypothetical protein